MLNRRHLLADFFFDFLATFSSRATPHHSASLADAFNFRINFGILGFNGLIAWNRR
jgi:hypothetical protein